MRTRMLGWLTRALVTRPTPEQEQARIEALQATQRFRASAQGLAQAVTDHMATVRLPRPIVRVIEGGQ